jgi:Flp pilus assembly protein TadD
MVKSPIGYWRIGVVHLVQARFDEAIRWFEKARSTNPGHPLSYAFLASVRALKGETESAATALLAARSLSGDNRYSNITRVRANGYWGVPKIQALFEATYFAGLRKAGMAEE